MNLSGEAKIVQVGRHKIKITPPKLAWWLKAWHCFGDFFTTLSVLQAMGPKAGITLYEKKLTAPTMAMLDMVAKTTNKRSHWPRRPGYWYLTNLTPVELSDFVVQWLGAIGIDEIKEGFTKAGVEMSRAMGQPKSPASTSAG